MGIIVPSHFELGTDTADIAVDLDDVIFPFHRHFLAYHNEHYGTNIQPTDIREFLAFDKLLGCTFDERWQRIWHFNREPSTLQLELIPGAKEVLAWLKVCHRLALVTARQHSSHGPTEDYLSHHLPPDTFVYRYYCNLYTEGPGIQKAQACLKLGARYLIDDSLENAIECAAEGITVILFDDPSYGWNKDWSQVPKELKSLIIPLPNWYAIQNYFTPLEAA